MIKHIATWQDSRAPSAPWRADVVDDSGEVLHSTAPCESERLAVTEAEKWMDTQGME